MQDKMQDRVEDNRDIVELTELLKKCLLCEEDDDIEKFIQTLQAIKNRKNYKDIKYLITAFDDETDIVDVHFSILHAIEAYYGFVDKEIVEREFLEAIPSVYSYAKEWVKLMISRTLNSEEYLVASISVAKNCSSETKAMLTEILNEIKEGKEGKWFAEIELEDTTSIDLYLNSINN